MRNIFIIICSLFFSLSYCQNEISSYYLYLNDYRDAPRFEIKNNEAVYIGTDKKLKEFFNKYTVLNFYQAFPEYYKSESILSVYFVQTTNNSMINELIRQFPNLFRSFDDITNSTIEPLYYPNDYGTTSPVNNLGADASRKDLDYLHVPDAWNITKGKSEIIIGISDLAIDTLALDLNNGKVKYITGDTTPASSGLHGTGVAEIAAGRGNNAHGSVGVCMDCNILYSPLGFGNTSQIAYSNLYKLANEGARVINMSWMSSGYANNPASGYVQVCQDIINYLVDEFGVVFVAAAGNSGSFSSPEAYISKKDKYGQPTGEPSTPFGVLYVYPACYDNVISVSSINHKNAYLNPSSYCCTSPWFPIYLNIEDSVGINVDGTNINNPIGVTHNGFNVNQYNPTGFQWGHTLNEKVDILATGYDVFWYPGYLLNEGNYAQGTSISAPIVSGTIGLMLSVQPCLVPKEIESILKLTTKDIEHMALNQNYFGYVGSGKLETGNAVQFVNEMKKSNGNATIKNHIFYRDNFLLNKINNKLTINSVVFKEVCSADFTAKNIIEILPGSDFNPNAEGFVDLQIDNSIVVTCTDPGSRVALINNKVNEKINVTSTKLYPNPNNGTFDIILGKEIKENINVEIYDISGKVIYKQSKQGVSFNINVPNLSSGMYIVRLSSGEYNETIKFIKD